ncbi:MAG TPA: GMC family oxidoreductase N-terminal domain-containing protein [Streptosporangiaceae bacterium]
MGISYGCPGPSGRQEHRLAARQGAGGSSGINAMAHLRGRRADYDGWSHAGASGWGYYSLLPYFKRSECAADPQNPDSAYRGFDGPLRVRANANATVLATAERTVDLVMADRNQPRP